MGFNANKFFQTEFEPFYKDIPVPALAGFFDPSPGAIEKLDYAKKKFGMFQEKKYKDVKDLEFGLLTNHVVALEWRLEKYPNSDDCNSIKKELESKREELQQLLKQSMDKTENADLETENADLEIDSEAELKSRVSLEISMFEGEISILEMAAEASKKKSAIFRVRNPGAAIIGKVKEEAADKFANQEAAIKALLQEGSSLTERIEGFAKNFHLNEDAEMTFKRELGFMTTACFYNSEDQWKPLELPIALKIAENFPVVHGELVQEIYKAMGEGAVIKKPA